MSYPASARTIARPPASGNAVPWALLIGGALVLVGLGLIVVAVSMRDDSSLFTVGGLVVGTGVLRLTTALSKDARRRRHAADPNDPRWHGGSGLRQLAGRTCAECGRKIVVGTDGVICRACDMPTHVDCESEHRAQNHDATFAAAPRE